MNGVTDFKMKPTASRFSFVFSTPPTLPLRVRCTGQGFGEVDEKKTRDQKRETKKEVNKALKSLQRRKTRPIDPEEAAKGKLDVATVKDWGSGKLENLKVDSFISNRTVDLSAPLHVRLAKTLEYMETSGELKCGVSGLRPFEEWDFGALKYATVLSNLTTVHQTFEESVATLLDSIANQKRHKRFDINALKLMSSERGLDRGFHLEQDLQNFLTNTAEIDAESVQSTSLAKDYAQLILQLSEEALQRNQAEGRTEALCKILTHGYLLRITHLTSGNRVVSAAVDKLDLIPKQAVSSVRDYPEEISDPIRSFVTDVNEIGRLLTEDQIRMMFEELPTAFTSTAVLFEPLARSPRPSSF